jgi:energy-coupling factor transporter ATP-binding protein EcfA2
MPAYHLHARASPASPSPQRCRSSSARPPPPPRAARPPRPPPAASASSSPSSPDANAAAAALVFEALRQAMAGLGGGSGAAARAPGGATLRVDRLSYHPPGAPAPLISSASLELPPRSFGLIYGRSGAGKTTLLQLIAGLVQPTAGSVRVDRGDGGGGAAENSPPSALTPLPTLTPARPPTIGLVFQFPERHFLGDTLVEELTFGWPADPGARAARGAAAQRALAALSLTDLPLDARLRGLSDGYKRRVALAVQLARAPDVLLLDEPLAGLDWGARAEVCAALAAAKKDTTVLAVSHDLTELAPLVEAAWVMRPGGVLRKARWPPSSAAAAGVERGG